MHTWLYYLLCVFQILFFVVCTEESELTLVRTYRSQGTVCVMVVSILLWFAISDIVCQHNIVFPQEKSSFYWYEPSYFVDNLMLSSRLTDSFQLVELRLCSCSSQCMWQTSLLSELSCLLKSDVILSAVFLPINLHAWWYCSTLSGILRNLGIPRLSDNLQIVAQSADCSPWKNMK